MPDHKVKSFSYWRARFNEPYDYTLEDLLLSSFDNTTVQDRLGVLDEENEEITNHFNFINHKAIYEDFFCANFFGYEKGKIEQIIKEDFDSEEISSTAFKLPMDEQFLKGKLYFVCFGNHLIAAQNMHLKVLHLAKYLNDKFHERCREFPEGQHLTIERTIRRTRREEIRGAKRISLSSPLPAGRERPAGINLESQVQSYSVGDRVWDAIEILTNKSLEDILGQFQQFDTRGIVEEKDIEVTLSLLSVYKMTGKLKQLVGIGFCILPWGITVGVQSRYKSSKMRSNRHF